MCSSEEIVAAGGSVFGREGCRVHQDARAAAKGIKVECHVPTHSLINYTQWQIVSPESSLLELPAVDGYIAQIWTGTITNPPPTPRRPQAKPTTMPVASNTST